MSAGPGLAERVSVILVNFNGLRWLDRCLTTLLGQTWPALEIVVVDNASTDGSADHVRLAFPTVRVVPSPINTGFAAGNQLGVSQVTSDLVLLLNTDAWVEPDLVARLVSFRRSSGLDVVAPYETAYEPGAPSQHGDRYVTTIDYVGHPFISGAARDQGRPNLYLSGACLLFGRQLWEHTGGMDPNFFMYCEEVDWFWRLALQDRTYGYAPGAVVHHDGGAASAAGLRYELFRWRNENTLQMLLKNYGPVSLSWVLPVYLLQSLMEATALLALGKVDLARSYAEGLAFNLRHLRRTLHARRQVQRTRRVPDRQLRSQMYLGSAKLAHVKSKLALR